MRKSLVSAALIGGLVVAGSGTGFAQQAKAASPSSVVNLAQQGIGQKYVWGANDCSGFTQKVFAKLGVSLPRTAAEQATVGVSVSQANLQPGDLVFFHTYGTGISHVGIYVGNNMMISAENATAGVRETQIFNGGASSYWAPAYVTARRVVSSQSAPQQTVNQNTTSTAASNNASNTSVSYHPAASVVKSEATTTPSEAQNATSYTVQSGDTLSALSLKTNVSVANLKAINGLTSDKIFAGQVLKLKGQAVQTPKPQTQAKAVTSSQTSSTATKPAAKVSVTESTESTNTVAAQPAAKATQGTYFVRTGDSLWAISRDNGISVSQIKTANHLSSDTIFPGQKLNVAKTANVSKKYTIKKGDTLWDIAVAHGTTVFRLVEANHITSTTIFPNQKLVIPQK